MTKWNQVSIFINYNIDDQLLIIFPQLRAAYLAIEEYKANGSGGTWDDVKGANIDVNNPDSVKFWVYFSEFFILVYC